MISDNNDKPAMTKKEAIKIFEEKKVRTIWDDETEEWYFSVVDVVSILTDSTDGRKYWNKLKQRLKAEGSELVTICHQLTGHRTRPRPQAFTGPSWRIKTRGAEHPGGRSASKFKNQ